MFGDNIDLKLDTANDNNYNLRVVPIKVMLNTNIPKMKPFPLHFKTLYHHDLEKGRFAANQYEYPLFTNSVRYPMSVLAMKTYSDRVDFFFNKNRFTKICRKFGTNYIEYDDEDEPTSSLDPDELEKKEQEIEEKEKANGDYNIQCMLIMLLPVADEFINVFQSSYDQYILNQSSSEVYTLRNIDPVKLFNPSWLPFYNYFADRKYHSPVQEISYLKQNGKKYVVNGVIWLNDIVNHPIYREFLSVFYQKNREKINNRKKIQKQMRERLVVFNNLLTRNEPFFPETIGVLLKIVVFDQNILTQINFTVDALKKPPNNNNVMALRDVINSKIPSSSGFNQKDQTRRETVFKMCNYLLNARESMIKTTNSNDNTFEIIDNIVKAYNEYSLYNESADKGMVISLNDQTRTFVDLYNSAIFLKSIQLIDLFLNNKINRFDVSEKNEDDTPKTKLELDIIRSIKKNFPYYIQLNDDILKHLKSVIEPARRSSNVKLQTFLKDLFRPSQPATNGSSATGNYLVDIYNKYIANTKANIDDKAIKEYMDVGISSIVNDDPANAGLGKECPEIYVYVNVVQKDDYENSVNRQCVIKDDLLANKLKQLLFANTMMDRTFPEINPYRSFTFLPGSEPIQMGLQNDNSSNNPTNQTNPPNTNKSNSTNPYLVQPPPTNGGRTKKYKVNTIVVRGSKKIRRKTSKKHNLHV
jgi:hypothetical protein